MKKNVLRFFLVLSFIITILCGCQSTNQTSSLSNSADTPYSTIQTSVTSQTTTIQNDAIKELTTYSNPTNANGKFIFDSTGEVIKPIDITVDGKRLHVTIDDILSFSRENPDTTNEIYRTLTDEQMNFASYVFQGSWKTKGIVGFEQDYQGERSLESISSKLKKFSLKDGEGEATHIHIDFTNSININNNKDDIIIK